MPVQNDNFIESSEANTIDDGTTQFVTENVDAGLLVPTKLPPQYFNSYFPNDVSSIAAYLAKPIPILSSAWNISATAGTLLFDQNTWDGVYGNTMWKEKLHGFYGMRGTLRLDLVLNATPFHQGRLRLCYYPVAKMNQMKAAMHKTHRIPISQLPGVDIGCGDESVSLLIPYVAPGRFIEMTSNGFVYSWGDIYLCVMSALLTGSGADSTVDYTLWYSIHDLELFGQTNTAIQQSGVGRGKPKRLVPTEQEQKPISYALGAASDFAGTVAKIPLLTPWAGPVSWFLNAARGAAYAFGFSKPLNTEKPCMMGSNYNWYTTTSDGLDNSMPLSLITDAKLKIITDASGGQQDQMSINFIKSQWSYFTSFNVAESNTPGQQLAIYELTPHNFKVIVGTGEAYYTPVAYLSKLYGLYRGGLEVMFKFVKTGFHAGSLAFTYVPGPHDNPLSYTNTSYCYRTIIDIQQGDQCCFRCPYLLPLDFFEVGINYGAIYVHVVNPLRAPETCADNFDVLVYVRGAESLQFQKPRKWSNYPVTPQGGEIENISEEIVCSAPGDAPIADLNLDFCQDSMSECATSTLQLIKRFSNIAFEYTTPVTNDTIDAFPWVVGCGRWFGAVLTPPRQCTDYILAQVLAPFAFYRGGVRWRVTPISTGTDINTPYVIRTDDQSNDGIQFLSTSTSNPALDLVPYTTSYTIAAAARQTLPCATNVMGHGGLSIQVPYQNVYRFCPIQYANTATTTGTFATPRATIKIWLGEAKNRLFTRAVADDFQAIFWVGVPRFDS